MCITLGSEFQKKHLINHLNNLLEQHDIPQEVYDFVKSQYKSGMTHRDIRIILKNNGFNKYYESIGHILDKLQNKKSVSFNQSHLNQIINIFDQLRDIDQHIGNDGRRVCIGFPFFVNRLFILIGIDHSNYMITLSQLKKQSYMSIWKQICTILNWPVDQSFQERSAIVIQKYWRKRLAQKQLSRLKIGREIKLLPIIGIDYQNALFDFSQKYLPTCAFLTET